MEYARRFFLEEEKDLHLKSEDYKNHRELYMTYYMQGFFRCLEEFEKVANNNTKKDDKDESI